MINWTGIDGGEFGLTVSGYEFPAIEEGHDANWLNVAVSVSSKRSSWQASSPCILTWDLLSLTHWLTDLEAGDPESWCGLEVDVVFTSLGWSRGRAVVAIALSYSLSDPAAHDQEGPARDIIVVAPSAVEIAAARAATQRTAERFPARGEQGRRSVDAKQNARAREVASRLR